MSNFDTNPKKLKKELLDSIDIRETALPDFQRDFVWQPGQTLWLIKSLAQNFPAGSLLRIESGHEMFQARAFAGAPELDGHKPKYLILDGQQRLTSLYQALYGKGQHLYYVRLTKLIADEDIEEAFFFQRRTVGEKYYSTAEQQAKYGVLPLHELFGGGGFHRWLRQIERVLKDAEANSKHFELRSEDSDRLVELYEKYVEPIVNYEFPVVTLPDSTSLEAVCTIFETLNSSGVRLSVFDLLAARFFAQRQNLRQMWADALTETLHLEDFQVDPYYLLQVISARVRNSIKRSEVLDLNPEAVSTMWSSAVLAMDEALDILFNECGVFKSDLLPYNTILVPLATAIMMHHHLTGPAWGAFRKRIKRWYWCSVFGQSYESSPTSQTITDINEIAAWMQGGPEPTSVRDFAFEEERLLTTTARQRAVYRGVLCLILREQPMDFYSTKELTPGVMEEHHVDDHHIFPGGYLSAAASFSPNEIDAIVNRTLIDRETNQRIGKNPPSRYLAKVASEWDNKTMLEEVLASHFIPFGPESGLLSDDYETFRRERARALYALIMNATS